MLLPRNCVLVYRCAGGAEQKARVILRRMPPLPSWGGGKNGKKEKGKRPQS
nr:MAG TPA: hypothetical protein [Caudoviricetes sp.]